MVEIRNLKPGEEDKLIETMYSIFSEGVAKIDYFRRHVMNEDIYSPSNVKVVVDNNKILSHVVIQKREMYVPNGTITVGGIALVGTLESHRRRGYITNLLDYAIEDMKNRNYDSSILLTKNPYFRNSPWKLLKMEFVISGLKKDELKTSTKNFNELTSTTDLLKESYNSFSKDKRFLLKRSESYWKNRLANDYMFPKDNFWFFFDNGNFVGYAVYETKKNLIEIREATWKDNNHLDDIVVKASQIAQDKGLDKIGMFGSWLKKYNLIGIIDKMDDNFYEEEVRKLTLKENIEIPKEPILF